MMKPLSGLRKALVSGSFLVGLAALAYGYILGNDLAWRIGGFSLVAFLILFALLILPYWNSGPGVNPEMN